MQHHFSLLFFFVNDQTLHRVMNLGTQMLDWSDTSSTWVNHGGASCILLDSAVRGFLHSTISQFLSKEDILVQDKDFQDTILVSIHNTVCTDLLAALEYSVLLRVPAFPLEVGNHFLLIMTR